MKRLDKKGFTLIEIIVVVVILAVLMAVAVPSVLNYINEADNARYMTQARSAYTEMNTELTKALGHNVNKSLSSYEVSEVLSQCQFSGTQKIIAVTIPQLKASGADFSRDDSIITARSMPSSYLIIFGTIDDRINGEHFAVVKENDKIEITDQLPIEFQGAQLIEHYYD